MSVSNGDGSRGDEVTLKFELLAWPFWSVTIMSQPLLKVYPGGGVNKMNIGSGQLFKMNS